MRREFVLDMGCKYPFGSLGEVINQNTSVSVRKKLFYSNQEEYENIQHIIHFLKAAHHQHLINLAKVLQNECQMQLYYQYVPLKLEGWLLDVNEELMNELQSQFLELAEYLCRSSIKFKFNPDSLGVSTEMKLKYFLNQFEIDIQHGQNNLKNLKKDIKTFFADLKISKSISRFKEEINRNQVKQLKKSLRMGSFSTNASYSARWDLTSLTDAIMKIRLDSQKLKRTKGVVMNEKLENNKRKCHQIIQRYKKLNCK